MSFPLAGSMRDSFALRKYTVKNSFLGPPKSYAAATIVKTSYDFHYNIVLYMNIRCLRVVSSIMQYTKEVQQS